MRNQKINPHFIGRRLRGVSQLVWIRIGRGGKSRSQFIVIRSDQWILSGQLRQRQMITDAHDISDSVRGIQGSRGVGDNTNLDVETAHDVDGQNDRLHVVTFVRMEASSKTHGGDARQ
jgi:hypothetical protein